MSEKKGEPTLSPPGAEAQTDTLTVGVSEPEPNRDLVVSVPPRVETGPTLAPPGATGAAVAEAVTAVAATWTSGVTVDALWSINEVRNGWFRAAGVWRKIYNGRDGAFTALLTLASQARQTGRTINYRQEADGMVYEIYLW